MINIIGLRCKLFIRRIQNIQFKISGLPLLGIVLFLTIFFIHFYILSSTHENNTFLQGWIIVGLFLISAFFGLISNRLPSKLYDFTWIYSLPKSDFLILMSLFIARVLPPLVIWLGSAIVVDIIAFASKTLDTGALSTALVSLFILVTVELIAFACSTVRGDFLYLSIFAILISLLLVGYVTLTWLVFYKNLHLSFFSSISELGKVLNGTINITSFFFLFFIIFLCLFLIYKFGKTMKFKERLIFEADFWSQHEDFNSFINSLRVSSNYRSWWKGKFLDGKLSFVWFELLLIRKNLKSLIFQLILTILVFHFLLNFYDLLYYFIFGFLILSTLFSGYVTGTLRHYHSNTLLTTPGSLLNKVITIELTSIIPTLITIIILDLLVYINNIELDRVYVIAINLSFVLIVFLHIYVFFRLIVVDNVTATSYYKNIVLLLLLCIVILSALYRFLADYEGITYLIPSAIFLGICLFSIGIFMLNLRFNKQFKGGNNEEFDFK